MLVNFNSRNVILFITKFDGVTIGQKRIKVTWMNVMRRNDDAKNTNAGVTKSKS